MENNNLTSELLDDTLELELLTLGEEEMLTRYHIGNMIYLYGAFESNIANEILAYNNAGMPLTLYESPLTATIMASTTNLKNPIILRFAVDTPITSNTFDSLIEESKQMCSKTKTNTTNYRYIREYDSKNKILQYKINDAKLIFNVQSI